jgi:hypothetical protein
MQYTEQDLKNLIETVQKEFTAHLAKAESETSTLTKAEDKKDEHKEEKAEEKKEEKTDDKAEEHKEAPKAESKEEMKEEHKEEHKEPEHKEEASKEAAPEAKEEHKEEAAHADEHCDYDDEDMEHLHKMYSSMNKAELKVHHDSVRSALDKCGMAKCGDMSMEKSEKEVSFEIPAEFTKVQEENTLLKSEVESYKTKADSLQKNLDAVKEFLTKFVQKTAPKGKAITSLEVVQKSEIKEEKPFNEQDIKSILAKKAAEPTLSKSDREAINDYYLKGKNINIISHLLK